MAQVKSLRTGIKFKDTPIGKIPVDWEVATLESISNNIYRYPTYYNIKYVEQKNGVPEIRGELIKDNGELSDNLSDYRFISKETSSQFPMTILREGDFVISVRGTLGKIGYVSAKLEGANMTANLIRVSPKHDQAFPLWLKQILLSDIFQKKLHGASSATTIKTITAPELKGLNMPLPPLPEQKKIAEILTTVDVSIEETDRIIEKTKELKKGLMQKLLTRGINHKKFEKTEIGKIPAEWEIVKLIDISKINPEQIGNSYPTNYQIKYLDIAGITQTGYINDIKDFTLEEAPSRARRVAQKNDILVSTVRPYLRAFARLKTCPDNLIVSTGYAVIRPKNPEDSEYIYQNILDDRFIKFLLPHMTGTNYPAVRPNDIGNYLIALPPENERKEIADILTTIDLEIDSEEANKQNLETLKKSLMQVLLTGKVRVKLH